MILGNQLMILGNQLMILGNQLMILPNQLIVKAGIDVDMTRVRAGLKHACQASCWRLK
jgi:hypothetical protein